MEIHFSKFGRYGLSAHPVVSDVLYFTSAYGDGFFMVDSKGHVKMLLNCSKFSIYGLSLRDSKHKLCSAINDYVNCRGPFKSRGN